MARVEAAIKRMGHILFILLAIIGLAAGNLIYSFAEEKAKANDLEQAIWQFQHENYEEALSILKDLRAQDPQSAEIAYYLGLTYKRMQNFPEARPHLEAAVTLSPKVPNALPELIDLLYQMDNVEEAKKWIEVAERESVTPAQTDFFKGLVLLKEGKDADGAVKAFEEAEKLDESLSQTVKYYKGMAYMQSKKYGQAKDIFRQIVIKEPTADMAAFANEYIDAISRTEKAAKPFNGYVNYAVQYDDNVILKPQNEALSAGISDEADWRQVVTAQGELNLKPTEWFGTRGGYTFYGTKQFDLGFYDTISNDFYVNPAFYLKKASVVFPVHYNLVSVNDKDYLETLGVGNMDNIMLNRKQMLQTAFQYNVKDYKWGVTVPNENRDAREYLWTAGWFYFFGKKNEGFFNLRYAMNYEDAKGNNWTFFGNRISASSTIPVLKKVRYTIVGDYYRQNFMKTNTIYTKKRTDDVFTFSNLLAVDIWKDTQLQLQYTYVNDLASIGVYKYDKNTYSVGVKYDF